MPGECTAGGQISIPSLCQSRKHSCCLVKVTHQVQTVSSVVQIPSSCNHSAAPLVSHNSTSPADLEARLPVGGSSHKHICNSYRSRLLTRAVNCLLFTSVAQIILHLFHLVALRHGVTDCWGIFTGAARLMTVSLCQGHC